MRFMRIEKSDKWPSPVRIVPSPKSKGFMIFYEFLFVYKMDDFLKMFRSEGREGGHFLWDCSHITSAKNNYFVELCGDKRFRTF